MVAARPDGWERRRRQVVMDVERCAFRLVRERGYAAVTMADVARAAGMSIRTVHRYFPLRDDLLMSVVRRRRDATLHAMARLATSDDPLAEMLTVFEGLAADFDDELEHYSEWMGAVERAPELHGRIAGELLFETAAELSRHVARAWGVDPAVDPRPSVVSQALLAAIDAMTRHWYQRGRVDSWPDLIETVRTTLGTSFASSFPASAGEA